MFCGEMSQLDRIIGRAIGGIKKVQRKAAIQILPVMVFAYLTAVFLWTAGLGVAADFGRPARFLPEERRIIEEFYRREGRAKPKGLPPGLAKRGSLPPGLQKHLAKNGQLPPGLQKRLEPLPADLGSRLPRLPDYWERRILERDIILLDTRTNRILDIIEDVIDLAAGR